MARKAKRKPIRTPKKKAQALTCSVPEAGELLGVGRNAAYAAAERGDIYTVQVGPKLKRVPLQWLERKLAGGA